MNEHQKTKWAPFNAVMDGKSTLTTIMEKKNEIAKPILSEEQINELENIIIYTYQESIIVEITYYKNKKNNKLIGQITKLDSINKNIIIDNHISIPFDSIINIHILRKNT